MSLSNGVRVRVIDPFILLERVGVRVNEKTGEPESAPPFCVNVS